MSGTNRRRSTSEGEGDLLSNTLNLPEAVFTPRLNELNPERCTSTPQINVSGFIDDNYSSNRGTRLEPRPRTRSRGGFNAIDKKLTDDFAKLQSEIIKWGKYATYAELSLENISNQHNTFSIEIDQRINEVLGSRGDFRLVSHYRSLKDRLNTIRRTTTGLTEGRAQPNPFDQNIYPQHPVMTRSFNDDPVFQNHPTHPEDSMSSTPTTTRTDQEVTPRVNSESRRGPSGIVQGQGSMRMESNPTSLQIQVDQDQADTTTRRTRENEVETWMKQTEARQCMIEEKVYGLNQMLEEIRENTEDLKSNTNDVWERLKTDESRMIKIESKMERLESSLEDNLQRIQDCFIEISSKTPSPDIPRDIIDSLKNVINDSSPGIAVECMRAEIEEIRDSVDQSRCQTEGLKSVMADLSDQVINISLNSSVHGSPPAMFDSSETIRREREIVKKGIERTEKQLKHIIQSDLSDGVGDIALIKKHKTVDVPAVHAAVASMQKSLQKYVKFSGMDHVYCESIDELLDSAENWCLKIEDLYNKAEVHSINTSKGDTADVGVFSDNAKVTVYEFLEAAEIAYLGWGNSVQKANRLYNHHLSGEIKSKLINMSDSYSEMKTWLINNYGGVSRIVSDILRDLSRKPKPGNSNCGAMFTFYAYVSGALQRLERLTKVSGIDKLELEACLYSRSTLTSLSLILLNSAHGEWITEMTRAGLDYKNPVGEEAYKLFKNLCIIERNKSEGSRDLEKPINDTKPRSPRSPRTNKMKSTHNIRDSSKDEEIRETTVYATSFHNTKWYQAGLKFPCPIKNHQHEISTCGDFFAFSPVERWAKMDKGKICYTCISPKDQCSSKRCGFESRVPESLKCQGCAPWAKANQLGPLNILFCRKREHANQRAPFQEMKKDMEKYLGKLGSTVVDSSIKFAANYTYQVFSMDPGANALGWVQEDFADKPAPSIDSETGKNIQVPKENIVPEIQEHSCYLMQTVKIGGTEALIFFDRGANIHIIDGSMAEREGLQKVSSNPTSLTVVGGDKVKSNHGTYRFNLGPGENGEYHEVVCVGMDDVTASFETYDLSEICKEYRDQAEDEERMTVLPPRVGGSRVHLLLGIKNTNLDPALIKILPSGVAVYLSPFRDIYGSRLIFAGPHNSFTKADGGRKNGMSNAVFLIREQMYEQIEAEQENRCFSITTNEKLGLTVNPYPINEEDILESCGMIPEQFEESIDDHEKLLELLEGSMDKCKAHGTITYLEGFKKVIVGEKQEDHETGSKEKLCDLSVGLQALKIADPNAPIQRLVYDQGVTEGDFFGIHKAHVPIAKFRNAMDDEDLEDKQGFRCVECAKCITCKTSNKRTAISLREAMEQQFIEDSVRIDLEKRQVLVNYPFLKDPVDFLTKVHNGPSNYAQAVKVYKTQCRKPELVKDGMKKVHQDLVEKGFMKKLEDMDGIKREMIENAPFQHFNPWRLVMKMDSVTTPVRMVVDPTMSRLNEILAKGENRIGLIFTIMIRCRCMEHIWSSDISKLYNQLIIDDPSLPYSLFLFGEELDPAVKPDIWVMVRAWYGIVSTGGQAGFALDKLTEMMAEEFPEAYKTLKENRYVDDLLSGAQTKEMRDRQIHAVQEVLKLGGFSLKFIVRSGEKPSEKASPDGETMKLLGYKWDPIEDELSPGLGELNLNKKTRGEKKPNLEPVRTVRDAERLLAGAELTRSLIVGKISEFFDPCGFFEPVKLQMKLLTGSLKGRDWDEVLPEGDQIMWKEILKGYVDLPDITIPRLCIPGSGISSSKIRLLCLADAAEHAGGAAIYAGRELSPGTWSCSLLAAKSKMMKGTVPRNELSAILLCAELAFMVKAALGQDVGEIIYVTDSTIALSWCSNQTIKLRLFVYNRVMTILRLFEWATGRKENPLWHIDGNLNLADLLTKKHEIGVKSVSKGSDWIEGVEWMRRDKEQMPLKSYEMLKLDGTTEELIKGECFPGSFMEKFSEEESKEENLDEEDQIDDGTEEFAVLAAMAGKGVAELLVDPVFQGWRRALRITGYMQGWRTKYCHKKHLIPEDDCNLCKLGEDRWDPRNEDKKAEDYFFRWETDRIRTIMKPSKLKRFIIQDGILYDEGRLSPEFQFKTQDLDKVGYLDKHEIIGKIPVVLPDSPVLYSFLMFLHTKANAHASLETTVKEVFKKMRVTRGLRRLVRKIIQDCMKCRLMEKKTMELRLANHPEARTVLAPCFHSCMMDICYGFKGQAFKRSRTVIKIYGLVIVCLLSGATNIMALEGIETQDVCAALERHSCRYGVPGFVYVDNGTQLKALQYSKFSTRDLESQVQDNLGIKIIVSNAKAHSERGRVERRIRMLRETMEKLGVETSVPMTALQWDTLFSRISNSIDNLPIARGDRSNETTLGYEIITPNRLKLGRNNHRSLEGNGIDLDMTANFTKLLHRNRSIYQHWYQSFIENVHLLSLRPNKWLKSSRLPKIDDLVIFLYSDSNHAKESTNWRLGKIVEVLETKVSVKYHGKTSGVEQTLVRSMRDISIVYSVGEMMINTRDHFDECSKQVNAQEE